ncbi:MAG: hypothetical protein MRZ90_03375 [Candidatus Gastranaerophilales bacterium]|nr:hypothetical protein [Candidatus Gastranaerophilales bacterium]
MKRRNGMQGKDTNKAIKHSTECIGWTSTQYLNENQSTLGDKVNVLNARSPLYKT